MRKTWLASAVVIASVTSPFAAFAADLPLNAPARAPIALYNWTGCYIGGHVGGALSDNTATNLLGASTSHNSSGFVGGGQIGCDYQFVPGWVLGVEGRAAWTSLKASNAGSVRNLVTGVTLPSQVTVSNDFLASATARLGYSFVDRWLFTSRAGPPGRTKRSTMLSPRSGGSLLTPARPVPGPGGRLGRAQSGHSRQTGRRHSSTIIMTSAARDFR
jgi:outer membrane immunogenic protein